MRGWMGRAAGCAAALGLALGTGARGSAAASLEVPLVVALRDGSLGSYGSIRVEELAGGDLGFEITLSPSLGPRADLHELYFNLVDGLARAELEVEQPRCNGHGCNRPLRLRESRRLRWGGKARFDFRVDFGHGPGPRGNGQLLSASFVLDGDEPLALADLLEQTAPTAQGTEALFAASVQSARREKRLAMETVAAVPEPETAALMLLGLAGLAVAGRRPRR